MLIYAMFQVLIDTAFILVCWLVILLYKIDITVFAGLGFTPICRVPTKSRFQIGGYQKRVDPTNTCEQD